MWRNLELRTTRNDILGFKEFGPLWDNLGFLEGFLGFKLIGFFRPCGGGGVVVFQQLMLSTCNISEKENKRLKR